MARPIIESILDTDLYKLTMQQAVHRLYPRAEVRYGFFNRGGNSFPDGFDTRLSAEIRRMESVQLTQEEATYLEKTCYFLSPVYIDFLRNYRFRADEVTVHMNAGQLRVDIEGPWFRTILWEVPLMALISELYFEMTTPQTLSVEAQQAKNREKAVRLRDAGVKVADFGTRRRFSAACQKRVIEQMLQVEKTPLFGTSNVHFARQFGITPVGTHAHEWFMFHGAEAGYRLANKAALDAWVTVYQGNLGIALCDTYTTGLFLQCFDGMKARLFDGVRHDSGSPMAFTDSIVAHYRQLRIAPLSKTIVFSDGLDVDQAIAIKSYCEGKINATFGIGTHLTNDLGPRALNMVVKMTECRSDATSRWVPTVKLSDVAGKHTGNADEVNLCLLAIQRSLS